MARMSKEEARAKARLEEENTSDVVTQPIKETQTQTNQTTDASTDGGVEENKNIVDGDGDQSNEISQDETPNSDNSETQTEVETNSISHEISDEDLDDDDEDEESEEKDKIPRGEIKRRKKLQGKVRVLEQQLNQLLAEKATVQKLPQTVEMTDEEIGYLPPHMQARAFHERETVRKQKVEIQQQNENIRLQKVGEGWRRRVAEAERQSPGITNLIREGAKSPWHHNQHVNALVNRFIAEHSVTGPLMAKELIEDKSLLRIIKNVDAGILTPADLEKKLIAIDAQVGARLEVRKNSKQKPIVVEKKTEAVPTPSSGKVTSPVTTSYDKMSDEEYYAKREAERYKSRRNRN